MLLILDHYITASAQLIDLMLIYAGVELLVLAASFRRLLCQQSIGLATDTIATNARSHSIRLDSAARLHVNLDMYAIASTTATLTLHLADIRLHVAMRRLSGPVRSSLALQFASNS